MYWEIGYGFIPILLFVDSFPKLGHFGTCSR